MKVLLWNIEWANRASRSGEANSKYLIESRWEQRVTVPKHPEALQEDLAEFLGL